MGEAAARGAVLRGGRGDGGGPAEPPGPRDGLPAAFAEVGQERAGKRNWR